GKRVPRVQGIRIGFPAYSESDFKTAADERLRLRPAPVRVDLLGQALHRPERVWVFFSKDIGSYFEAIAIQCLSFTGLASLTQQPGQVMHELQRVPVFLPPQTQEPLQRPSVKLFGFLIIALVYT